MNPRKLAHDYWITMRPYLLFVSGSAGLAGIVLAGSAPALRQVLVFGALFLCYGLGQALTDLFQLDTDTISAPYRPLVRGTLGRQAALTISAIGLMGIGAVLAWLEPWTAVLVILGVAGLLSYTWCKRRFWAGPLWNAWVMALVPLIGFLATGGTERPRAVVLSLAALTFFSYAVFVLLGYFKDIAADRATGYDTLPVRYGRRVALWVSVAFAFGAAASLGQLMHLSRNLGGPPQSAALVLLLTGAVFTVRAHVRMVPVRSDAEAHPAIADSVRAFVALHLGVALWFRPELLLVAVVFVALFEASMATRPDRRQI